MEKVQYISIALAVGLLTLFAAPILLVTVTADPPDPTPQPVEEWSIDDPWILVGPLAYPTDPTSDIPWSAGASGVADIQAAFNNARDTENTQLGTSIPMLTLPSQAEWDAKSNGEKALWLINREREDRGVHPLHGLETNVTNVAQDYAEYLIDHNAFGHDADGRDPWERLNDNPAIGACHDFLSVAENLAVFVTSGTSIPLPVERAVHMWMYEGASSSWWHRHAILWYPYNDNSGPAGQEGFLGIGREGGGPYQGPFPEVWNHAEMIVMNVFDPCSTWVYEPSTSPSISLNYQTGQPGSFFKVTGQNFPANTPVTITVNGQQVGTVNSDGSGGFVFSLQTSASAQEGVYAVSVNGVAATYRLDQSEPLRSKDPDGGETIQVPDSIAPYSNFVYLPIVLRGY
jgi:uncharacterized protein YkwD